MNTLCKTLVTIVALVALCAIIMLVVFALCAFSKPSSTTIDLPNLILSLMGVCATLIVGVSVYNTVDVSSTLRKTENKMEAIEVKLVEMEKLATEIKKIKKQTNILFHHTWGMTQEKDSPYAALHEYWRAFEICVESNDYSRGKSCIDNALKVADLIKSLGKNINDTGKEDIPHEIPDKLKGTKLYNFYKQEIDTLFEKIKDIM